MDGSTGSLSSIQQRQILCDLYNATNGEKWRRRRNWCSQKHIREWQGVEFDNTKDCITAIYLSSNNLSGNIPDSLGQLNSLKELRLHGNMIHGEIPLKVIGLIAKMRYTGKKVVLSENEGLTLPANIGDLDPAITVLDLSECSLTGTIPGSCERLKHLKVLFLNNNKLSGTLSLGAITLIALMRGPDAKTRSSPRDTPIDAGAAADIAQKSTRLVDLSGNSGLLLPANLGDLRVNPSIVQLDLSDCSLIGPIPPSIGSLVRLFVVKLDNNQLSGSIPSSLKTITALEEFSCTNNQLDGAFPSLKELVKLKTLRVGNNKFAGLLPASIGQLKQLRVLDMSGNLFNGNIPRSFGNLTELRKLSLASNKLNGVVPATLKSLANLIELDLNSNKFAGPIPEFLFFLLHLEILNLGSNLLTGTIPELVGNLDKLKQLCLFGNQLSGPLPAKLTELLELERLVLCDNQLSGPIPRFIEQLVFLIELDLHGNLFAGPIPACLGKLEDLKILRLNKNQLIGAIPREIGDLVKLEALDLSDNALTESIPEEIGKLRKLKYLGLERNRFQRPLPKSVKKLGLVLDKDIFSTEDPTLTAGSKAEHDAAALWPSCWSRLRAVIVGSSGPLPQLTADADTHTYVSDYEASMAQLKQERGGGGEGEGEEAQVVTDADVDAAYYEDDSSSDHEADEDEEEDDFDMSQFEFFGMSSRAFSKMNSEEWIRQRQLIEEEEEQERGRGVGAAGGSTVGNKSGLVCSRSQHDPEGDYYTALMLNPCQIFSDMTTAAQADADSTSEERGTGTNERVFLRSGSNDGPAIISVKICGLDIFQDRHLSGRVLSM